MSPPTPARTGHSQAHSHSPGHLRPDRPSADDGGNCRVPRRRIAGRIPQGRRPASASPHYGEKWGRHWLDVARYADSNGLDENLAAVNAFRYRNYVINAFNEDKPYDQFVREQIAGDLLKPSGDEPETARHARHIATGFLSVGAKMLAEDDGRKMEMDIIDEQLDTLGRAFMGMTLGCARCHDHKFDPIPTSDYYALAGILKSTHTMDNHKVVPRSGTKSKLVPPRFAQNRPRSTRQSRTKEGDRTNTKTRHQVAPSNRPAASQRII